MGWTQGLATISDPSRDLQKYDVWLSKVDSGGKVVWTQQLGSKDEGAEFGWAVDTDSQDNVYISGWTTGALGELGKDFAKAEERDVFLAKFTPEGDMEFTKQFGSKGDDGQYFSDMFIDASDNIFLTGYTDNKLGKGKADGTINAWVGRFDTSGNNQWIQQIGIKDKADYATGITASNGKVFVTGFTEGFLGASNNGAQGSAIDGWLAELDIKKGKLQEFEGSGRGAISIANPGAIAVTDVTNRFATGEDLPRGGKNIPNPGAYYGDILDTMALTFAPNSNNSLQASLRDAFMNDPSVFSSDMPALKLEGSDDDDFMMAFMGDDKIKGDKGDDTLYGSGGNDELNGGDGDDILIGVDPNFGFGAGEIDELKGDKGADIFVLGDAIRAYYLGNGKSDHALIQDYDEKEGDTIQLHGKAGDYSLGSNIKGLDKGTAIFFGGDDLVGIVKDAKDLDLADTSVFTFV